MTSFEETIKQIDYLARALKAPRIPEAATRLGEQARDAGWSHEEYLAAVLDREASARDASGAELRLRPLGSRHARRSRTSPLTSSPPLNATPSPTSPKAATSLTQATSFSLGRPAPAKHISPSAWALILDPPVRIVEDAAI